EDAQPAPNSGPDGEDAADASARPDGSAVHDTAADKSPSPMAAHFAPVEQVTIARQFRRWAGNDAQSVVWGAGGLVQNMIAVIERRLIEQASRGLADKPLGGAAPARLADVAAFLSGPPFDDARCAP